MTEEDLSRRDAEYLRQQNELLDKTNTHLKELRHEFIFQMNEIRSIL